MRMSDWSSDLCSSVQGKDGTDIMLTEINFDGIIGPTHNYAGLSRGNIASASNAGGVSQPRAAALQGLEKMRRNLALGLPQGFFVPLDRPDAAWLETLGTTLDAAEPHLRAQAWSASSMWAANAARSEEHTSELQSLMRNSYAVFCLKKKTTN